MGVIRLAGKLILASSTSRRHFLVQGAIIFYNYVLPTVINTSTISNRLICPLTISGQIVIPILFRVTYKGPDTLNHTPRGAPKKSSLIARPLASSPPQLKINQRSRASGGQAEL